MNELVISKSTVLEVLKEWGILDQVRAAARLHGCARKIQWLLKGHPLLRILPSTYASRGRNPMPIRRADPRMKLRIAAQSAIIAVS